MGTRTPTGSLAGAAVVLAGKQQITRHGLVEINHNVQNVHVLRSMVTLTDGSFSNVYEVRT